jgi:hypothetical protein
MENTLKMEATSNSETSVHNQPTRLHILENGILPEPKIITIFRNMFVFSVKSTTHFRLFATASSKLSEDVHHEKGTASRGISIKT